MKSAENTHAKHIIMVAGEESGDAHAAMLIRQLLQHHTDIRITGIGGQHMRAAGAEILVNLAQYGVTGVLEVLKHLTIIRHAFKMLKTHLKTNKPDLLILIDYPGFNLRLARYAKKKLGIRILYYISPQIWAWKAGRIETIRRYVDSMAVILPFEKALYEQASIPVAFVGHPLIEKIHALEQKAITVTELNLPSNKQLIAMLPGSRRNEIERHMPVLRETAERLYTKDANLHFVIPVAKTIPSRMITDFLIGMTAPYSLTHDCALETVAVSKCVIVASGTASLECALLQKPMCIIYKASLLTYVLAAKFLNVRYLGLCNLLQNKMSVPELLQYDCNAEELSKTITELLYSQPDLRDKIENNLALLKHSLSRESADCSLLEVVEKLLFV